MIVALIIVSILLVIVSFLFIKNLKKVYFLNRDNEQLHQQSCEDRRLIDKYKQNCKDLEKENKELKNKFQLPTYRGEIMQVETIVLKPQGIETVINIAKDLYEDKEYRDMINKTACEKFGRIIYENEMYETVEMFDIMRNEYNIKYRTWVNIK